MAEIPLLPPIASYPTSLPSPKKVLRASKQAIFDSTAFWLPLSLSKLFLLSMYL
jgi:hypothetical protein